MHRAADKFRSEVRCTRGGQSNELVQSASENDKQRRAHGDEHVAPQACRTLSILALQTNDRAKHEGAAP